MSHPHVPRRTPRRGAQHGARRAVAAWTVDAFLAEPLVARALATVPALARRALEALFRGEAPWIASAPGSAGAHQAWPGGFLDHLRHGLHLAEQLYPTTVAPFARAPFAYGDVVVVWLVHDLEKPYRYVATPPSGWQAGAQGDKAARAAVRLGICGTYGLGLTVAQRRGLRHVEGEGADYQPGQRTMTPLAAFCHILDVHSARIGFDRHAPAPR